MAQRVADEELALARSTAEGLGVVLWPGYDFPPEEANLRGALADVNQRLRAELPAEMAWVDVAELQRELAEQWEDDRLYVAAGQHPSAVGSVALVEKWLSLLRVRWGKTRKVLVTDLDNVLWGGTVGEDGVEGLRIGAGSPAGEAHLRYQEYLVELKGRGVLLAVCSKNNEADARDVFARRSMPLKTTDFAGWLVNWNDKAENLQALAEKLRLGSDSFVFVDDEPAERARVRQALPEVAVPEWPVDPDGYVAGLRARRFFDNPILSAEDRGRAAAYQADEKRAESKAGATSLEDFLCGLEMVCEHGPVTDAELDRMEQLLARTNQWNLTTRQHSRAEIAKIISRPGTRARWFRLRDRFGDNGIVGFWLAVPRATGEWEIESWVMSCRVIGRGLEDLMFNIMLEGARAAGARQLRAIYRPTAKNKLVAGVLPGLGFTASAGDGEERRFSVCASAWRGCHSARISSGWPGPAAVRTDPPVGGGSLA